MSAVVGVDIYTSKRGILISLRIQASPMKSKAGRNDQRGMQWDRCGVASLPRVPLRSTLLLRNILQVPHNTTSFTCGLEGWLTMGKA